MLPDSRGSARWARGGHGLERLIEHLFASVDFLGQVQDQRRELGCVARADPGAECGQAARERTAPAHCRPGGHLGDTRAPKREEAPVRAGGPAGSSGVVPGRPLGGDYRVWQSDSLNGITLHQLPQIPGSGDFLPNFLPKNAR